MNNVVFGKTIENVRKHRYITLFTTERRRNYHTTKFFTEHLLVIEVMNKSVYLGRLILELRKILIYEFWYDYVKPNMVKKQNCVIWIQIISLYT